jgi:hypothetical protein
MKKMQLETSEKKKCVAYPQQNFLFKIRRWDSQWLKTNQNQNYH